MSDINNLAENLGLATNNRFQNNMPFTKAASTELNLALQQKKEEKARAEAERKMQEGIMARIKFKGNDLDKIGQDVYSKELANVIARGATTEDGIRLEELHAKEKLESELLGNLEKQADKLLLPSDVKTAYKNKDYNYLRQRAQQDPNLGLMVTPSGRVLLDANKMVKDVNVDDYFAKLNKNLGSDEKYWNPIVGKTTTEFGRLRQQAAIKPEVLQQEANNIFSTDPNQSPEASEFEHNYLVKRQKEINSELAKPIYSQIKDENERLITAAKQVFINEGKAKLKNNVEVKVDRSSGGSNKSSEYYRSGDTLTTGKADKWTYTFDPATNEIKVNTGATSGVSEQNLSFRKYGNGGTDITKVDKNPVNESIKLLAVKPLKSGEWMIRYKKAGSNIERFGITNKQSLQDFMYQFPASNIVSEFYANRNNNNTNKVAIPSSKSNKETPQFKGVPENGF